MLLVHVLRLQYLVGPQRVPYEPVFAWRQRGYGRSGRNSHLIDLPGHQR